MEHREDQAHRSALIRVPVIRASGHPYRDADPVADTYVIDIRRYRQQRETWVYVGSETDTAQGFNLTSCSAAKLGSELVHALVHVC